MNTGIETCRGSSSNQGPSLVASRSGRRVGRGTEMQLKNPESSLFPGVSKPKESGLGAHAYVSPLSALVPAVGQPQRHSHRDPSGDTTFLSETGRPPARSQRCPRGLFPWDTPQSGLREVRGAGVTAPWSVFQLCPGHEPTARPGCRPPGNHHPLSRQPQRPARDTPAGGTRDCVMDRRMSCVCMCLHVWIYM